jgi:hypothetical protein
LRDGIRAVKRKEWRSGNDLNAFIIQQAKNRLTAGEMPNDFALLMRVSGFSVWFATCGLRVFIDTPQLIYKL